MNVMKTHFVYWMVILAFAFVAYLLLMDAVAKRWEVYHLRNGFRDLWAQGYLSPKEYNDKWERKCIEAGVGEYDPKTAVFAFKEKSCP